MNTDIDIRVNAINDEILTLKRLLSNSDYKTLKYLEGLISDTEYVEIKSYREKLRAKINQLEEELAILKGW